MYKLRPQNERGKSLTAWLDSSHTFSFADYHDPAHMGFSDLRVINDDYVAPNGGFATHPHRDMEIISVVLEGRLEHKDSMGNGTVINAGEIQKMSAGTGILHSEFNPSDQEPVHFLQIWIYPDRKNLEPSYQQRKFSMAEMLNQFRLVVAPDGRDDSITIAQDAELYMVKLEQDQTARFPVSRDRKYWVHAANGETEVLGKTLTGGDGMALMNESGTLEFKGRANMSTILVFNLRNDIN